MEVPYFKINGTDILPWVETNGIQWKRKDLDSAKSGRTMDMTMHRGRVAIKYTVNITCLPLRRADEIKLMQLILPEFVTVDTNLHPLYSAYSAQYYSNNVPATISAVDPISGETVWADITFPLVEK